GSNFDMERAEDDEARHGVEAHQAYQTSGVVAEAVCGVRVHELVDRDAEDDRHDETNEADGVVRRVADRRRQSAGEECEEQEDEDEEVWPLRSAERAAGASGDHLRSSLGG